MSPSTEPKSAPLPGRVDSAMLLKRRREGEPVVIAKFIGVGNLAPYDYRANDNRAYVFRFESAQEGHILRVPLRLWQENKGAVAHAIMDNRRLPHPMVVQLELTGAQSANVQETALLTEYVQALGLLSTLVPEMEINANDPLGMAKTIFDKLSKPQEVQAPIEDAAPANTPPEMGATDTSVSVQNVVGLDTEPTVAPAGDESAVTADPPLHEAAYALVEPPKRIKALAALLGVEEGTLRTAIDRPESKVELAQAGWVRRKA